MVPVSSHVVQWFRRNGHFDDIEAGLGVDSGRWWVVDIFITAALNQFLTCQDIFYIHVVLNFVKNMTVRFGADNIIVRRRIGPIVVGETLSWSILFEIEICELSGLFLASAFFWLI